jgi:hypothetical protein
LFKNTPDLNLLYKQVPDYKSLFEQGRFMWFDEHVLSNFLKDTLHSYKIKWDTILCNQEKGIDSHQEYELNRWYWKEGQLTNTQTGKEVMYLHFINWKRTMRLSEVSYQDKPKPFYISYQGLHYQKYSNFKLILNTFKNVFFGYYKEQNRRLLKLKIKSLNKRLTLKVKKIISQITSNN